MMAAMQQGGAGAGVDQPAEDTAETIHISSLALLKMLKHCALGRRRRRGARRRRGPRAAAAHAARCRSAGRAGVPFEVMGLMLGAYVDDYTIKVVDVFAMPQRASNASVEAVDPVYQAEFLEMLKQTNRCAAARAADAAPRARPTE